MSARQQFSTVLAAINIQKPNYDILMAVFDCMYPENGVYVTCTCNKYIYPHVKNKFCESDQPRIVRKTAAGPALGAPYESKPMVKDGPAVEGVIIPVVTSMSPRNVIAEMREEPGDEGVENSIDHFVDEPDDDGKRGW